jgi:hypothetical protein
MLARNNVEEVEDLGLSGWGGRYLALPPDTPDRPSGRLVHAVHTGSGARTA